MPSKSFADLLCYFGFRSSGTFALRCYGPESDFICVSDLDWGFNFEFSFLKFGLRGGS